MRRALVLCLAVCLLPAGCTVRRRAAPLPSPYCRGGPPLEGVYHPDRLRVRSDCKVVTGVVDQVKFEAFDGDVHVEVRPDDAQLVSRGNDQVGGNLVVEIIPQDRALVGVPAVGAQVTVVGPWVEDTKHGWMEIHPTWLVAPSTVLPASPRELQAAKRLLGAA